MIFFIRFCLLCMNIFVVLISKQVVSFTKFLLLFEVQASKVSGCWCSLACLSEQSLPLSESKLLAGEFHRSSGLLMLCCALMCMSAGQRVIMCVRLWVLVLHPAVCAV